MYPTPPEFLWLSPQQREALKEIEQDLLACINTVGLISYNDFRQEVEIIRAVRDQCVSHCMKILGMQRREAFREMRRVMNHGEYWNQGTSDWKYWEKIQEWRRNNQKIDAYF